MKILKNLSSVVHKEEETMKGKKCEIVFNTRWGYTMQPIACKSISEAIRLAKQTEMAYRIKVKGKTIKSGWIVS